MTALRHFLKEFLGFVFSVKSLQRCMGLGKLCRAWERDEDGGGEGGLQDALLCCMLSK